MPPRGPPGAGVGTPPAATGSPVAPGELLGALKLLQKLMSAEDFSKYEKTVLPPSKEERTKEREQLLWEKVQSQNRLRKQEAGHVDQIAKLEADAAKQRTMLQGVLEQLEAVNDEVCALRALVADPTSPSGQPPEPPPLPAPRTPPPLDIVIPPDQDMENCENEDDLEWKPVRRLAHWDRRDKMEVIKGYTKQRQEKRRLPASKHFILEGDECCLSTRISDPQSGKEIASRVVQHVSREAPGSYAKLSCECVTEVRAERHCCCYANSCFNTGKVPVGGASRLRGGNQAKKGTHVSKFPFLAVMLVPGQQRLTVFCVLHPHPVLQVLWQVQVLWRSVVLLWLFLLRSCSFSLLRLQVFWMGAPLPL